MRLNNEIKDEIKRLYKTFFVYCAAVISAMSILTGYAYAQNEGSVVLIQLKFDAKGWSWSNTQSRILPCGAPTKFIRGMEGDPFFQVLDRQGKVLNQQVMRNPRRILIEDPKSEPLLLSEVSFALRFPLTSLDGTGSFAFWDPAVSQSRPVVSVDLLPMIKEYMDRGGPNQKAACQQPVPAGVGFDPPKF